MVYVENNSILKKISAVIVMITALVFFSFNVFAETDFQYTTTVSNQDSINGVVITLKANRGSLINTGTAALGYSGYCPVLVTITLQNTNSQNVLINNLKFKVTTNSSGNYSHIVSFEQLSSDLIVAETPYDLNNYISIVPSNEYSYGTGIVVPANSSMYMVCLMNVYANYDTNNNQWAVPSLQYIGYDQNITVTTGDYHSTGVPVDLSQVVNAIEDVMDNMTTYDQMEALIASVKYTGSNFSPSLSNYVWSVTQQDVTSGFSVQLIRNVSQEYYLFNDVELNPTTDTLVQTGTKVRHVNLTLRIMNYTGKYIQVSNNMILNDLLPFRCSYGNLKVYSQLFDVVTFGNWNNTSQWYFKNTNSQYGYIPPGDHYSIVSVDIYRDINDNTDLPVLGTPNITSYTLTDNYFPLNEYMIMRDLYLAYSNVNGLDDSSDISNDVADVSDSNHIIEESYYSANASAIEATGLSNYRFSNEQNNGIGSVSNDFMLLWNALGSWNGIYIFSLTMALATFIMRHGGLFTVKKEVSDKGGEGD